MTNPNTSAHYHIIAEGATYWVTRSNSQVPTWRVYFLLNSVTYKFTVDTVNLRDNWFAYLFLNPTSLYEKGLDFDNDFVQAYISARLALRHTYSFYSHVAVHPGYFPALGISSIEKDTRFFHDSPKSLFVIEA